MLCGSTPRGLLWACTARRAVANFHEMATGAAWTVGLPDEVPAYSLARVTDVIEVHPYPTETISQRNYYVQPTNSCSRYRPAWRAS